MRRLGYLFTLAVAFALLRDRQLRAGWEAED